MQNLQGISELRGYVTIVIFDEEGKVKETREFKNLVVDVGRSGCAGRVSDPGTAILAANWIKLGTDATVPAVGQTALIADLGLSEAKSAAYSFLGIGSWKIVQTWGTGAGIGALTESGVFFGSFNSMLCRQTFAVINKASSDTLEVTWGFTLTTS